MQGIYKYNFLRLQSSNQLPNVSLCLKTYSNTLQAYITSQHLWCLALMAA